MKENKRHIQVQMGSWNGPGRDCSSLYSLAAKRKRKQAMKNCITLFFLSYFLSCSLSLALFIHAFESSRLVHKWDNRWIHSLIFSTANLSHPPPRKKEWKYREIGDGPGDGPCEEKRFNQLAQRTLSCVFSPHHFLPRKWGKSPPQDLDNKTRERNLLSPQAGINQLDSISSTTALHHGTTIIQWLNHRRTGFRCTMTISKFSIRIRLAIYW